MSKKDIFSNLQKIGKSLMLPVSVLPAAGLMLRLGQDDLLGEFGFAFQMLSTAGSAIFNNLPLIFAVGVAIGFSGGKSVAALSAVIGELILRDIFAKQSLITGTTINMGVFGGILIGLMTAILYNRYHNINLPKVLGFFSGKRFIPIITSIGAFIFAIISLKIWIPIQNGIDVFANWASASPLGPAFYAAGKRLLIPVGLHHIYYQPFLFQFGEFISEGISYFGDSPRFFQGDPTAGIFMAAEYPVIMFGLPGAAMAIIMSVKKENRKKISGIMISAALVAFLTGITEPIEFTFIFIAPILYIFHVGAAFMSGLVTSFLNIRLGYTFSASFIDYLLGYPYADNPLLLWIVGFIFFMIYFWVFYFTLKIKDIDIFSQNDFYIGKSTSKMSIAERFIDAAGGKENIQEIDACVTRLRLTVIDSRVVDRNKLKELGAAGIFEAANSFQIVMGTEAEKIMENIVQIISNKKEKTQEERNELLLQEDYGKLIDDKEIVLNEELEIYNPLDGKIISLDKVKDDVFSERLLGEGFAIIPNGNKVYSPIKGEVSVVFPTKHAIVIKSEKSYEIMIHIGIDTVRLNGEGFNSLIKQGDIVEKGQHILTFDREQIMKEYNITTPIIVTNLKVNSEIYVKYGEKKVKDIVALITNK